MENQKSKVWYEKTWLVILLCIIFFPVGLYALWKNSSINKVWKIIITIIIAIIFISSIIGNDNESSKTTNNESSKITNKESSKTTNKEKSENNISQFDVEYAVKYYLKKELNDPDSYESIEFSKLEINELPNDIIEIRKIKFNNTKVYTEPNGKLDEGGAMDKDDKIYILESKENWLKFRATINKASDNITWNAWVKKINTTPISFDNSYKYSIIHKYRAKNGFGGYIVTRQKFYLDATGNNVLKVEDWE